MEYMFASALGFHKFFAFVFGALTIVYFALTRLKIDKNITFYTLNEAVKNGIVKFPALRNLRGIKARKKLFNGRKYLARIRKFLPVYYAVLAAIVTTGAVMLPVMASVSVSVGLMCVGAVCIMGLCAVGYKRLKRAFLGQKFEIYRAQIAKILGAIFAIILIVSFI
ncbi:MULTISPECIES: hypothetical protein [unclassified Campylobacter]|uniref:hypothetical protein n=1 Tax=unclassified Campylobacter TaxID=2593542 RepID=UPI0022E9F71F|nr:MULTISPECIES: hypothetical protein [unclassified Campylobacter]MDA3043102.1 hypothetical protein [Campylobacter sp. JMF_09 ED2]MDA3063896.1 hypothetical protein [Campylobacter sp. JMF_11 EL3]MDA3075074.1 hypothetical protein [Campylobacter sp. JMF_05 ED3]